MKNTFYRPKQVNTEEFSRIVTKMQNDLDALLKGNVKESELKEYLSKLVSDQMDLPRNTKMGFWGLEDPEKMPSDARIDYFYMPTYIASGILMYSKLNFPHLVEEISRFQDALKKGLYASTGRSFQGHGYGVLEGKIEALTLFIKAKAHVFINKYPNDCDAFTKLFKDSVQSYKKAIATGNTKGAWGEDYTMQVNEILNSIRPDYMKESMQDDSIFLFVYGTLMKNNCSGMTYLDDARFICDCTLNGYALYDLGAYPGIVEDDNASVRGELYEVPNDRISDIDKYEGEGYLYKRRRVEVHAANNATYSAVTYVYNQSIDRMVKVGYEYQPWHRGVVEKMNSVNYVWYAAYGSNINKLRFMKYIEGCSDKTPPIKEKQFIFSHPIYFANTSRRWGNKGVAFLDIEQQGRAYGKLYLVTEEQLEQIHGLEGNGPNWYNQMLQIGYEEGLPIKTITHTPRHINDESPSQDYLNVIKQGMIETYPLLSEKEIDAYLLEASRRNLT